MTILIDCRFAALHAGLGRYTRELVTHLVSPTSRLEYVLLVRNTHEEWLPRGMKTIVADIPHYSIREQTELPRIICDSKADLFFCPHFNVPFSCPIPFIITVHDLILHRYPNHASLIKRLMYRAIIGRAVKNAQRIIAVSDFTAKELSDAYGADIAGKTEVVREGVSNLYHPVSDQVSKKILEKFEIHRPYFLYVGNAKEHKNVPMLLEAFRQADLQDADLILVSGGDEIKKLSLPPNVRILTSVSDQDLPALYSGARALVTASLYEGYCLPVAEALACGCPVIASNRTAIPEVASGHALLLEPTVAVFADAFRHPPARSPSFIVGTWEQAAKETEKILLVSSMAVEMDIEYN